MIEQRMPQQLTFTLLHRVVRMLLLSWHQLKSEKKNLVLIPKYVLLLDYFKSVKVHHEKRSWIVGINSRKITFRLTKAWKHSNILCKNYILSGVQDDLYNVYNNTKTSKELWNVLKKKYKTEDAGMKKFIIAKFLEFKLVDNKALLPKFKSCKS